MRCQAVPPSGVANTLTVAGMFVPVKGATGVPISLQHIASSRPAKLARTSSNTPRYSALAAWSAKRARAVAGNENQAVSPNSVRTLTLAG